MGVDLGAGVVGFRVRARRGLGDGVDVDGSGMRWGFAGMIVWKPGRRRGGCWVRRRRRRRSLVEGTVVDVVDAGVDFEEMDDDEGGADDRAVKPQQV